MTRDEARAAARARITVDDTLRGHNTPPWIKRLAEEKKPPTTSTIRGDDLGHMSTDNHVGVVDNQAYRSRVALGIRFEFFAEGDLDDEGNGSGPILGAIIREDLTGAAVPRAGEALGYHSLSTTVTRLVGRPDPVVHHVDHYLQVPGDRDRPPLCMLVSRSDHATLQQLLDAKATLKAERWHLSSSLFG